MSNDDLRDRLQSQLGDHYTLEREIGGGGMSRVFVAEEKAFGRKVVVKVLPPDLAAAVSVERFKREIVMAARLQHPHIVPVLTAGEVNGLPYYTMPLVRGESLRTKLQREGELPINETVRIVRDVAAALAHAHSDGVVHRDIKPDNVMLTGGVAVVTDLGVGKAVDLAATDPGGHGRNAGLTSIGVALGTPAYMSPEQAAADPNVDHRSDIYALGCIAYEMLTGATPFAARNVSQMLTAHMTEAPEPVDKRRESTPVALAHIVMRCLAKRPADRPQSANEIMTALEGITSSGTTAAAVPAAKLPAAAAQSGAPLSRALTWFFAAAFVVVALAYGATEIIGLPSWVPLAAIIVMSLGLPAILFTGWVQRRMERTAAHPTHTPGGTAAHRAGLDSLAARVSPHVSWRKTTMGGVAAVSTLVILVVAYMATRAMGIGPAASLSAAGKVDKNQKVLVADFTARGVDSTLAMLAAEAVRTDLGQSSALIPVTESEVAAILRLMGQADTVRMDLALARTIAQREGLRAIVTGDITPLPGDAGMVVALRLLVATSGDELAGYRETIKGAAELIPALGRLSKTLRAKAGESLKSVRATPPLERVTTSSIEALREYVEGQRANRVTRQPLEAVAHLRKAVAIDSLFAVAWSSLGVNLGNAGMPREQGDSAHQRAYDLRDRLSQVERYRVVSAYYRFGPGRDREQAARVYEEWLLKDTASFLGGVGANNYAALLATRRQFQRAAEIMEMMRTAGEDAEIHQALLVDVQFNSGRSKDAQASVESAKRRFPAMATSTPTAWEVGFLYERGQLDSVEAVLERLRRERKDAPRSGAIRALAVMAQLHGQLSKSVQYHEEARAADIARRATISPWAVSFRKAEMDIWFRDSLARGAARIDSIVKLYPISAGVTGNRPYIEVATLYARAGRTDKAREVLQLRARDIADTVVLRTSQYLPQGVEAEIALAEGKPLEAIKLWRMSDTLPDGPSTGCAICVYVDLGRGFVKANMPDSAIYWFEKYLTTPQFSRLTGPNDPTHLPGVYKTLGELYEAKGERTKARDYYQRFVALWDKADADMQPLVKQVREQIARLSGEPPRRE